MPESPLLSDCLEVMTLAAPPLPSLSTCVLICCHSTSKEHSRIPPLSIFVYCVRSFSLYLSLHNHVYAYDQQILGSGLLLSTSRLLGYDKSSGSRDTHSTFSRPSREQHIQHHLYHAMITYVSSSPEVPVIVLRTLGFAT